MKRALLFYVSFLTGLLLWQCEPKDESIDDPEAPVINLITSTISTAPDHEFWVRAIITDDTGIKRVNLLKQDWFLDKDIILSDSTRKEYQLIYKFLTPEGAEDDDHILLITVEDLGGNMTTREVPINLNKDIQPPVISISSPMDGSTLNAGDKIKMFIEVTDNSGIDTFAVSAPELDIDTLIVFDPVNPRYIFVKDYLISELTPDGNYFINVLASDSTGNTTLEIIGMTLGELKVGEVYCVGGASWSGWDTPDNPMLMRHDPENEGWYELVTYSFGEQDQNGVKFLGQRAWGPLNWGLDPDDPSEMIIDEGSDKIILEEKGYHKVRFSPGEMSYSKEFVGAETPVRSEMYILGSGIVGMENAYLDPSGALPMTQDPENPYIYTATVEFTDIGVDDWGACFVFIGNKNDLSEFNLGDLSLNLDPLTTDQLSNISDFPPSNGNWNGVPYIAYYMQAGVYTIKLDYHIGHASVTKVLE
jgi:hypothetical protein